MCPCVDPRSSIERNAREWYMAGNQWTLAMADNLNWHWTDKKNHDEIHRMSRKLSNELKANRLIMRDGRAHRNIDTIRCCVSLCEPRTNRNMLWILVVVANNDNTHTLNYVNGLAIIFASFLDFFPLPHTHWPDKKNFMQMTHKNRCRLIVISVQGSIYFVEKFITYFLVLIYYPGFLNIFFFWFACFFLLEREILLLRFLPYLFSQFSFFRLFQHQFCIR